MTTKKKPSTPAPRGLSIALDSGGTLTLFVDDTGICEMSRDDREFVSGILNKVAEYAGVS